MIREALQKVAEYKDLAPQEAEGVMREIMGGLATDVQIAALLMGLRMKGETIQEIASFAKVMKEFCIQISPKVEGRIVDMCGTGGDSVKTFNISTAAAFVVAGSGITVAKHGNRSVMSRCGSADVMERLGFDLDVRPELVKGALEQVGVGFLFAPKFHPAMKHAASPRREAGLRTIFNILGPLTNPANANAQLLGVYDLRLVEPLAQVLKALGHEEGMVVHGIEGLDEISTIGSTSVAWLRDGYVKTFNVKPEDFGVERASLQELSGVEPEGSAECMFRILCHSSPSELKKRDIVLVNAAAGIMMGGEADEFKYAMELARESIKSGSAYNKLKSMMKVCGGDLSVLEGLEAKYG